MARICDNCGKGAQAGSNVAGHSKVHTKRRFQLNLHSTKIMVNGRPQKMTVCSSCLRKFRQDKKIVK